MADIVISGTVLERSPALALGRITNPNNGQYITVASLSSLVYEVFDVTADDLLISSTALVVADCVFDAMQDVDAWDETDPVGYNFKHVIPPSAFPDARNYDVTYTFTFGSGYALDIVVQCQAIKNRRGDT